MIRCECARCPHAALFRVVVGVRATRGGEPTRLLCGVCAGRIAEAGWVKIIESIKKDRRKAWDPRPEQGLTAEQSRGSRPRQIDRAVCLTGGGISEQQPRRFTSRMQSKGYFGTRMVACAVADSFLGGLQLGVLPALKSSDRSN